MKTAQINVFDLSSVPVETLVKTICLWVRCDAEACSTKEVHEGMPKIRMNCCPCSEVIVVGIPKREIQPVRRAEAQTSGVVSTIGTASGQRVYRSTQVNR